MSHAPLSVVIAGSTQHTRMCAQALSEDPSFHVTGILTPSPKPIGRKQEIRNNPLHQFALDAHIPIVLIEKKIDAKVQHEIEQSASKPDLLLVVDFGYIVPSWLLEWPKIGPVNIHPSDLPKYRGSSPGQFTLAFGETHSAVSIMRMDEKLDHGPILSKIFFDILPTWTASQYYDHAFMLICEQLPKLLHEFAQNPRQLFEQADTSPTPITRMLSRDDGYVPPTALQQILDKGVTQIEIPFLSSYGLKSNAITLYNMWRGLTPWPGIWTTVTKNGKETRLKLLSVSLNENKLQLESVQMEGKTPTNYSPTLLETV